MPSKDTKDRTKTEYITDEELMKMSSEYSGWRLERVNGELVARAPVGKYSGYLEAKYLFHVQKWAEKNNAEVYSAQAGFKLPNGNVRSPDVSLLLPSHPFHGEKIDEFVPAAPDFLIEVRSKSDSLSSLQKKMKEWIDNGCRLAFLIDPQANRVFVYHPDRDVSELIYDETLSGEDVLPGFTICPAEIDL